MESSDGKTTILLADDHAVVMRGLQLLLDAEADFEVVATAATAEDAVRRAHGHKPDVAILDLNMPGTPTIDAIPELHGVSPDTRVVILTMQDDPAFARAAIRAGAHGYVLKESADDELVTAVRAAAEGSTYLNPGLGARLAAHDAEPESTLSPRESEVLSLIALGHTNAEIADQLFISVRTVESHRAHVQQKLGLVTRAELVRYALAHGLLDSA